MHIFQCGTHRQHTLDMAKGKGSIGLLFNKINRKEETKHLFLEAAAIRRKYFGPDHASTKKSEKLAAQCEYDK